METSTVKKDFVQKNVAKVKRITKLPNEDVYNMEVKTYHNFAVNSGLIVHNCMDCFRYICMDLPYTFINKQNVSFTNYMRFFEEQKRGQKVNNPLSFRDMLDIINDDNVDSLFKEDKEYAGGYNIC